MPKKRSTGSEFPEDLGKRIKELNKILRIKISEFQRTETADLPRVLPPDQDLRELKMNIEWCLKLWAEHDGFIFKPGPYYNE